MDSVLEVLAGSCLRGVAFLDGLGGVWHFGGGTVFSRGVAFFACMFWRGVVFFACSVLGVCGIFGECFGVCDYLEEALESFGGVFGGHLQCFGGV